MNSTHKKWISLALALTIVALASILTGCGNKEATPAAQQAAEAQKPAAPGPVHVRKWGESGFVGFSSKDLKPSSSAAAAASNEASNAKK